MTLMLVGYLNTRVQEKMVKIVFQYKHLGIIQIRFLYCMFVIHRPNS